MDVIAERPPLSVEQKTPLTTENLKFVGDILQSYRDAKSPESVSKDELPEALALFQIQSLDGRGVAQLWEKGKELLKEQQERERIEKEVKVSPWMVEEKPKVKSRVELADEFREALADLRAASVLEKMGRDRWPNSREGWERGQVTLLSGARQLLQIRAVHSIRQLARTMLREDALNANGFPYEEGGGQLTEALADLALAAKPQLEKSYQKATQMWDLRKEEEQIIGYLKGKTDMRLPSWVDDSFGRFDFESAVNEVKNELRGDAWRELAPTVEQTRALYDLISGRLFRDLYAGGRESWSGTASSNIFSVLRDPRAIPGLIEHLQQFGSGHTSNSVVYTIKEIVENPLSREDLDRVVAETGGVKGRILREWFLEPEEWVQKLDGYGISGIAQSPGQYFARGELAKLAKKMAGEKGIEFAKDKYGSDAYYYFFAGINFDESFGTQQIEKLLLEDLGQVAEVVARSKLATWRVDMPQIFSALVNPRDGNYFYFPHLVVTESLGLAPEAVAKLEKLYATVDLRRGAHDRTLFAEGILFLSSKDNGREIMEGILAASTGASRDPARIREIFRMMETLDSFGAFDFSPKGTLTEISSDLRGKVIESARQRMKLEDSELPALDEKLDYLLQNNLLEIIPTLMAKVSGHGNADKVVEEIGRHIVLGDFVAWRNSLETAQAALSVLPEDKREKWVTPCDEVRVAIRFHDEDETRGAATSAIKRIVEEAKAHIQEVYKLDFSGHRLEELHRLQQQLIGDIKKSQESEGKRELGIRKRSVDAEAKLIEGILALDTLDRDSFDPAKVLDLVEKTRSAMTTLNGLEQPIADLEQIQRVFTTQQKLTTVSQLRAYDSDDPVALLKSGAEPRETCQSWRQGSHNYCLPAYVADANKRVINVEDERGEVVGRSIARLTHIRTEAGETVPVILLEPVYTTGETNYVYTAFVKLALAKAKAIGADLVMTYEMQAATGADHSKTVAVLPKEAKKAGFTMKRMPVEVFIPRSYNQYEYSDTLGGDVSWFDRYVPLQNAVVVTQAG